VSRTGRRKLYYFSILTLGPILLVGAVFYFHLSGASTALMIVALLLPGRILGFAWRDQLAGLRLLKEKRFEESAQHTQRFLDLLARRPWIGHLIWLGTGTYSRDPQSLALNNLGVAQMCLGNLKAAKDHLARSRELDPKNPLPYFNLARLHTILGEPSEAREFLAHARRLGYSGGWSDKLIRGAQSRFAQNRVQSPVFSPETALLRLKGFTPSGFQCGIEILNDDRTPMEFVVSVLQNNVGLARADAIRVMLEIHDKGGALLPLSSEDESRRVAEAVTALARSNHHPLTCRAVRKA
jgi:ATP-dependent Clp protease adapter protein ClpS